MLKNSHLFFNRIKSQLVFFFFVALMFFVSPAIVVLLLFCCVVLIIARFDEKRADDHQNLFVELNSPLFLSHLLSLFLNLSLSLSPFLS